MAQRADVAFGLRARAEDRQYPGIVAGQRVGRRCRRAGGADAGHGLGVGDAYDLAGSGRKGHRDAASGRAAPDPRQR